MTKQLENSIRYLKQPELKIIYNQQYLATDEERYGSKAVIKNTLLQTR